MYYITVHGPGGNPLVVPNPEAAGVSCIPGHELLDRLPQVRTALSGNPHPGLTYVYDSVTLSEPDFDNNLTGGNSDGNHYNKFKIGETNSIHVYVYYYQDITMKVSLATPSQMWSLSSSRIALCAKNQRGSKEGYALHAKCNSPLIRINNYKGKRAIFHEQQPPS